MRFITREILDIFLDNENNVRYVIETPDTDLCADLVQVGELGKGSVTWKPFEGRSMLPLKGQNKYIVIYLNDFYGRIFYLKDCLEDMLADLNE